MDNKQAGIGIFGICVIYGLITQCLSWAGIISWPWQAIWGPAAIILILWLVAIVIGLVITGIMARRKK